MEPNNFEKDFRDKLNQRTIEPSSKAWDRLDAMLSVAEVKKPKKKTRWLYIAASIVGFLLVGTFFFNQKKALESPVNKVVIKENIPKKTDIIPELSTAKDSIKKETMISEKESIQNQVNSKRNEKEKVVNQKLIKINNNESNQVAESSVIIKKNQQSQSINNQISVPEVKNEVPDQLLNTAEKTVAAENPSRPKSKIKINASDLLNQVDGELELSFREKVIAKVNKNYQTVKVAVANRNQQE